MCNKVVCLAVLILAVPLVAFANSIDVSNVGGVVSGSSSGLSLTGSTLVSFGSAVGANLGSVSFTTGAFTSGDVQMGGSALFNQSPKLSSDNTNLGVLEVPEPGTLSLLGTSLVGLAGIRLRRRSLT